MESDFDEKLIEFVREAEMLWSKKSRYYKNTPMKLRIWTEISGKTIGNAVNVVEPEDSFDEPLSSESEVISPCPSMAYKKRKCDEVGKQLVEGMSVINKYFQEKASSQPATSSDSDAFGQIVTNLYNGLNDNNKKRARVHVVKYLIGLQSEELKETK
ncbi:hypothetical protein ABEB36_013836 [Hypothenemus hampei]|uniref:MADF domain-containing protein n=1 Tax=Hypothenemus hampei TaxID=57062 RepID=A0ABD1E2G8_HYPHA